MTSLPHSAAAERNRDPILAVLSDLFADRSNVLEIGSGTGQHAVFLSAALPHVRWQCSERAEAMEGLRLRLQQEAPDNVPPPIVLDVQANDWPEGPFDAAFTANTAHIMPWAGVEAMLAGLSSVLSRDAVLCIYGPFNVDGAYTAPSNAEFDLWLKQQDPERGIRNVEDIDELASRHHLSREAKVPMPANNFILVYRKTLP